MPIFSIVGRKRWSYRVMVSFMYAALLLGGLTMVVPFLFMLTRASATPASVNRMELVPTYLFRRSPLLDNYLALRYGELPDFTFQDWASLSGFEHPGCRNWRDLQTSFPETSHNLRTIGPAVTKDINAFARQMAADPEGTKWTLISLSARPEVEHLGLEFLHTRYGSDAREIARHYGLSGQPLEALIPGLLTQESFRKRVTLPPEHPRIIDYRAFKKQLAETSEFESGSCLVVVFPDGLYQRFLQGLYPSIDELNTAWNTACTRWVDLRFTRTPHTEGEAKDYYAFLRNGLPIAFLRLRPEPAQSAYREFIAGKYKNNLDAYNRQHQTDYRTFSDVPLSDSAPLEHPVAKQDWMEFFESRALPEWMYTRTSVDDYAAFVQQRYGNLHALNRAHGTNVTSFDEARPPLTAYDAWHVYTSASSIRWHLFIRNYKKVFRFLFTHGDAGINTVVLIFLTLLGTFTVNPMAAYALSRFRLSYAPKVLLFLLATMAFPAEVAMIPNFLITKNVGLLNTYAALILPGLANGMNIFLLKGFFDSLPQELYEAATIDGASELRCFFNITLPLSQPIMAYMAFMTFTATYAGWSWALLICQDPSMWTISVELFQYQVAAWNPDTIKFASFVVASIPTLIAFLLCQRLIIRGIVVPSMK